jgi:hypothetical protein
MQSSIKEVEELRQIEPDDLFDHEFQNGVGFISFRSVFLICT